MHQFSFGSCEALGIEKMLVPPVINRAKIPGPEKLARHHNGINTSR